MAGVEIEPVEETRQERYERLQLEEAEHRRVTLAEQDFTRRVKERRELDLAEERQYARERARIVRRIEHEEETAAKIAAMLGGRARRHGPRQFEVTGVTVRRQPGSSTLFEDGIVTWDGPR